MVGWHHRFSGHEFEPTLGNSEGQGSLVCCSPWGRKESDMLERLNNNNTATSEQVRDLTPQNSKAHALSQFVCFFQGSWTPSPWESGEVQPGEQKTLGQMPVDFTIFQSLQKQEEPQDKNCWEVFHVSGKNDFLTAAIYVEQVALQSSKFPVPESM